MATYTDSTPAPGEPPTRRLILSAFTGAAFAGTAVTISAAASAQTSLPACRDLYEVVLLAAFRRMNPQEREAALTMAQAIAERGPVPQAVMLSNTDSGLIATCAEYHRLHAEWMAVPGDDANEETGDHLGNLREEALRQIAETPHATDAGRRAKAEVALDAMMFDATALRDVPWREHATAEQVIVIDVLRDLTKGAVV